MKKKFNHPLEKVFDACIQALRRLNIQIEFKDIENGVIEASTRASILSWGEKIDIVISKVNDGCSVSVTSEATAQFFSWGKDSSNEQQLLDQLNKILKA